MNELVKRSILLLFISFLAGCIISDQSMWKYLHYPDWELNRYWIALLPLGVITEIFFIGSLTHGLLIHLKKKIKFKFLFHSLLYAFLIFEGIHLVRFLSVYFLNKILPYETNVILFWSFDPLAWFCLFFFLIKKVRFYIAKRGE